MKKSSVKVKYPNSHNCLLPIATLVRMIGEEQWEKLMVYIRKKSPKTKAVVTGRSEQGTILYSNSYTGKRLGMLADLMAKAKVQSNPKEEIVISIGTSDKRTKLKIYQPEPDPISMESKLQKRGLGKL